VNALRRTLLAALGAVLAVAAFGMAVLGARQDRKLDLNIGSFNLEAFIESGDAAQLWFTLLMALFIALAFIIIAVAFWPDEPREVNVIRVRQRDGTIIEVDRMAVESAVSEEVSRLPDIRAVETHARLFKRSVETALDVTVYSGTSVFLVSTAIGDCVERVLGEQFNVSGPRPRIRVSYEAAPEELFTSDAAAGARPTFRWPEPLPGLPGVVQPGERYE
jgi:hypothetical protein